MIDLYKIVKYNSPLISLALHDGHFMAPDMLSYCQLAEHERFREEDPYTAIFADLPCNQVVVHASRFMLDLNRRKEKSIYLQPEDAWGLQVWTQALPQAVTDASYQLYDEFYKAMAQLIEETIAKFGYFFILDIHSYNHRRDAPNLMADPELNPEVNLGTAYNQEKWQAIIQQFKEDLATCSLQGRPLDVRENIKFKGGGFAQWLCENYADKGAIVSIEFKKTFMDEWTGRADIPYILELQQLLKGRIPRLLSDLFSLGQK